MSERSRIGWLAALLLLGASTYAIAEDITLTTYYPSPRGVYQELRTQGDAGIGDIANPPAARLHVTQTGAALALRVDDQAADPTPFVIDQNGNVGVGTATPGAALEVRSPAVTALRLVSAFSTPGIWELRANNSPNDFIVWGGTSGSESERLRITDAGNVGIGTNAPTQPLDVAGVIRTAADYMRGADLGATADAVAGTTCDAGFNLIENRFLFRGGIFIGVQNVVIGSCAPPPVPVPSTGGSAVTGY